MTEPRHRVPVEVECYAGHKADETPRRMVLRGRTIEIAEVTDRWYQRVREAVAPSWDYFKVVATDGATYLLNHDGETDQWYLLEREAHA